MNVHNPSTGTVSQMKVPVRTLPVVPVQQGAPAVYNVTSNIAVANNSSNSANSTKSTDPEDEGLE